MRMIDAERELAAIKKEIVGLTAESLATHFILTLFFKHLSNADPRMRELTCRLSMMPRTSRRKAALPGALTPDTCPT